MTHRALRIPLVRPIRDRVRETIRLSRLRRCLTRLQRQGPGQGDDELLRIIRRVWGNEGWSADSSFLAEVALRARTGAGPFLDCGSGLSTVIAGVLAGVRGIRVWSLEQDEDWYRTMTVTLSTLRVENVTLWHAPLRSYGDFVWYDLLGRELPAGFSAVFCDGPSVSHRLWSPEQTQNWRSGIVPVLRSHGIEFGEIVLDDMEDSRLPRLMARWQAEGLETRVVSSSTGSLLIAIPARAS